MVKLVNEKGQWFVADGTKLTVCEEVTEKSTGAKWLRLPANSAGRTWVKMTKAVNGLEIKPRATAKDPHQKLADFADTVKANPDTLNELLKLLGVTVKPKA